MLKYGTILISKMVDRHTYFLVALLDSTKQRCRNLAFYVQKNLSYGQISIFLCQCDA